MAAGCRTPLSQDVGRGSTRLDRLASAYLEAHLRKPERGHGTLLAGGTEVLGVLYTGRHAV